MGVTTLELPEVVEPTVTGDPFDDLDVRILEVGGSAGSLINLTDNGCGSTCASPCATNVG
ncbi:FxLD family lanthipeptide [Polymorphospora sp. NPDC050346]|uniref:FxLD family lanthipeptide n=1 Tax=Polymorphospora sp. NPDC050346 TaxID=3155780 RepID=UPI0033E64B8B